MFAKSPPVGTDPFEVPNNEAAGCFFSSVTNEVAPLKRPWPADGPTGVEAILKLNSEAPDGSGSLTKGSAACAAGLGVSDVD